MNVASLARALAIVLLLTTAAFAQTPVRRVALVVSNSAYLHAPALANTHADGALVAAALRGKGFDVREVRDADAAASTSALGSFRAFAAGADVALIYLAGHGLVSDGQSWLISTDAPVNLGQWTNGFGVSETNALSAASGARRRIVLIDACRDSPFRVIRAPTPRGVGMPFAPIPPMQGESYIAYAARNGQKAEDGPAGSNGPFATALASEIDRADLVEFAGLLERVRGDVVEATMGRQEPALFLPSSVLRPAPTPAPLVTGDCRDCPAVVAIPGGEYLFGSPPDERGRDVDEVAPTPIQIRAFEMTRYEITRTAFEAFVTSSNRTMSNGCEARIAGPVIGIDESASWRHPFNIGSAPEQTSRDPVVCVDWQDANAYARWLSVKTSRRWRLPTEAEWEYAARAGAQSRFFWGDDRDRACEFGNGDDLTAPVMAPARCRDGYVMTAPVGAFKANAWGLYDTSGNVWEWTLDCDDGMATPPPSNGSARTSGQCANRTIRGGSFDYGPNFLRSASRHRLPQDTRNASVGFRLVREP